MFKPSKEIADAVAALVNSGKGDAVAGFSLEDWTAARGSLPIMTPEVLGRETKIIIVPAAKEVGEGFDRGSESGEIIISVGVSRNVNHLKQSTIDPVADLVEEIQGWITERSNLHVTTATCGATASPEYSNTPFFDSNILRDINVYLSVTNFSYSYERSRIN